MNGAMIPSSGGSSSNFAQQGNVDWIALSGSTLSFSIEVLSRFSKAGVEMVTVAVGQTIFSRFRLRADGQKRFLDSIAKLKAFSSYGNMLWFGFGVKHIVRLLSETEQGATCAAICSCLSVSYDSTFGSKVIMALADQLAAPETLTPSFSQWAALIHVCSGAVINTQFPHLVEGLSRLAGVSGTSQGIYLREPTSAGALANALLEIARVSRGEVRDVTLMGGADCGWIAAVCQWLFSLSVEVMDENGQVLYSNYGLHSITYAQVVITRCLNQESNGSATAVKKKSFLIPPGKLCFKVNFQGLGDGPGQSLFLMGRSNWSTILHDAFGSVVDELLSPKLISTFADFLCYDISKNCQPDPWGGLSANSGERQLAYISFASKRLPELAGLFCVVERITSQMFEGSVFHLENACLCNRCRSPTISERTVCLKRVASTILEYILFLSFLDVNEGVLPSASGLRALYLRSASGMEHTKFCVTETTSSGELMVINTLQLFTGFADRRTIKVESAACGGGICVYLASLKNPTTTPLEQLRAVVVAGQIERNGAIYEAVADKPLSQGDVNFWTAGSSNFFHAYGHNLTLELVIEETLVSSVLDAYLSITRSTPHKEYSMEFHPEHKTAPINSPGVKAQLSGIGPARIRRRILQNIFEEPCKSRVIQTYAFSAPENRMVVWTGRCSEAPTALWNARNFPRPGDWILVYPRQFTFCPPQFDCCRGVLFGSYALYYAIICSRQAFHLTTMSCIICDFHNHSDRPFRPVMLFSSRESELYSTELIREVKLASEPENCPTPTDSPET